MAFVLQRPQRLAQALALFFARLQVRGHPLRPACRLGDTQLELVDPPVFLVLTRQCLALEGFDLLSGCSRALLDGLRVRERPLRGCFTLLQISLGKLEAAR